MHKTECCFVHADRCLVCTRLNVVLLMLTGVWFAQDGQLLEVNLQVALLSASNIVAVQVLRPTCPQNKVVIRPGNNTPVKSPLS